VIEKTLTVNSGRSISAPGVARPATTVMIRPAGGALALDLLSVWHHGELLYFLIWRHIKVRYKQTFIGAGWAVLQPLLTMAIFTAVFGGIAKVPSDGVPYPIFAYAGLLPWSYFSYALARSSTSLVSNSSLISKVYFPRLIIPLSAVISPLLDLAVAFVLLVGLMVWYQMAPGWEVLALPVFLLLCGLTAFAVALWLAALCVRYRDVAVVIPFLVQIWMYASPVAYPARLVPDRWRLLYGLNPMATVIEGFRWALLGMEAPNKTLMAVSSVAVMVILYGGLVYFKRMERVFADVV
jgi:lipopolysaccharide transport system permease protein